MRGNSTLTEQQKNERWNRDIKKLFSIAKAAQIPQFEILFSQTIRSNQNDEIFICLICKDGSIKAVSRKSLSISFEYKLEKNNFLTTVKLSPYFFAIATNDSILYLACCTNNGFKISNYEIPNIKFIHKYNNFQFVAVCEDSATYLCNFDGSTQIVWEKDDKVNVVSSSVYENNIFICNEDSLYYGVLQENSTKEDLEIPDEIKKKIKLKYLTNYENGILCLSGEDQTDVYSISFETEEHIIFDQIFHSNVPINSINVIDDGRTMVCLSDQLIQTYSFDTEQRETKFQQKFNGNLSFIQVIETFPRAFAAFSTESSVYICRISKVSKKVTFECSALNCLLNEDKIISSNMVDDFSFSTAGEKGSLVIWESVPDWWDIPYCINLFDKK